MFVYIFLLLLCTSCGFLMDKININDIKSKKVLGFIAFFLLFAVSAIRFEVGTDYTNTYVRTYNLVLNNVKNIRCDIGFLWLNKFLALLEANVQWIFVITSLIINYFICKNINKNSKGMMLSYYIYICSMFYFFTMNGVRQSIAISLFYYSLIYIKDNSSIKYMITNSIGAFFHNSALIFLPLYYVLKREYKFLLKIIIIIITFLSSSIILPYICNFLLTTKYSLYINNGAFSPLSAFNLSSIINLILFFAYEKLIKKKNKEDIIYSNIHFVGIIVSLFTVILPLALRIFMSFRYIEFLSVPNLLNKIKCKKITKNIILAFILIFYFCYFIYGVGVQNGNDVLPYKTIFGGK